MIIRGLIILNMRWDILRTLNDEAAIAAVTIVIFTQGSFQAIQVIFGVVNGTQEIFPRYTILFAIEVDAGCLELEYPSRPACISLRYIGKIAFPDLTEVQEGDEASIA